MTDLLLIYIFYNSLLYNVKLRLMFSLLILSGLWSEDNVISITVSCGPGERKEGKSVEA